MLPIALDRDAEAPIYTQIKRAIIRQITDGLLAPGDRLPATRDLAAELGVARISVVAAYDELKAEGAIHAHVGRGTFVSEGVDTPADPRGVLAGTARPQGGGLRDLLRLAGRPGVIDFSGGAPPDSFLPVDLIRAALDEVLARDGASAIAYEEPAGYAPLRAAIAGMVRARGIDAAADEVLITGGCQQALDLAVQALLNPGDVLLTTNPTYAGILDLARARGVTPVGVPVDADGMQTAALEALIVEHRPRLLYVAPTYHNPTGAVMPYHRRRQLLDVAAHYRLPVLEDGVYEDLSYAEVPPPPLKALDTEGLVLYASSFSKVMLPGMRIGYLLAGGRLHQRLTRVKAAADICTPSLNQRALHLAIERGAVTDHIARVRKVCRVRRAAMLDALSAHLPAAMWDVPSGGLYLWVALPPDGPAVAELYVRAVEAGAAFAPGPLFYVDGQGGHHLRLNAAAHPPEIIDTGIRRIAGAWRDLAAHYEPPGDMARVPLL